jgi:hypothetical protein
MRQSLVPFSVTVFTRHPVKASILEKTSGGTSVTSFTEQFEGLPKLNMFIFGANPFSQLIHTRIAELIIDI